jgi:hypothetical protein
MTPTTWAYLALSAIFGDHSATERMMVRAGCPVNPLLIAAIDEHARTPIEASTLVALYRTEGLCSTRAVGDGGTSYGFGQVHGKGREWAWLLDDVDAQVRVVLDMVRASFRAGRNLPEDERLAVYCRGRASERGRELSRVRMKLARWARGGGW